ALAHAVLRRANRALADDPQDAAAFRMLGDAYLVLESVEGGEQFRTRTLRRRNQAIAAYNQAVLIEPASVATHEALYRIYVANEKHGLALRELRNIILLLPEETEENQKQFKELRDELSRRRRELERQIESARKRIEALPTEEPEELAAAATRAYQEGLTLHALELLEQEPQRVNQNPQLRMFKGLLLLEAGRAEEAFNTLQSLESLAREYDLTGWHWAAAIARLAAGHYESAAELWAEWAHEMQARRVERLLQTLPLVGGASAALWPSLHVQLSGEALLQTPHEIADAQFDAALSYLEAGENAKAEDLFRQSLDTAPETPLRPLTAFYLALLSDEDPVDVLPPSDQIPITPDLFAPEPDGKPLRPYEK
ncbi:MAG: hypothetical protein ACREIV_07765, partial [Planctomycetaceae bacterium]